ncbi:MAG: glycosyltransferase family 4 protein [Myxococcales bacterium]
MADKIGVLFLQAQDGFGADAAVHADIIRNLDRNTFDVHVACTGGSDDRVPASLAVFRTIPNITLRVTRFAPSLGQRDATSLLRATRAGLGFSADFVALSRYVTRHGIRIVHSSERPRDAAYNVGLSRLTGARSVVHVHVKWSEQYSKLARWAVRRADALLSISRYVTEALVKTGKPRGAIHTVLNGIEIANWEPSLDGSGLRRELGIPDDSLLLASVSRLFSWKGQRELVKAFALVQAERKDVRLMIVGGDAEEVEAGSFTEELKALARSLGVQDKVIFTGHRSDVPRVMAACDVFCLPSFEEPFGLVFLEAMAMRKPVVAVCNGGTPEVVEHGLSGFLSPPWDVPALAANIEALLGDRDLRVKMGQYGRDRVVARFTAQRLARDAGLAFERILADR